MTAEIQRDEMNSQLAPPFWQQLNSDLATEEQTVLTVLKDS